MLILSRLGHQQMAAEPMASSLDRLPTVWELAVGPVEKSCPLGLA